MRLVLAGTVGVVAGLAVGSALSSGGRHEIEETHSRSDPPASMRQHASFDERYSFNERYSFDQRFLFDQLSDSFEQRFATAPVSFEHRFVTAAVSPAAAPAATTDTEEDTGSVPSVVRLPSPRPEGACRGISCRQPAAAPKLASVGSPPPDSSAKKVRLASLEMPKGSSPSLDSDSRTAIYDITARTVYMPDGRRLEAHSGLGERMDDPRYVNIKREGSTPPNVYDLSLRESLFHGVRALRMTPVGDGKMYGRDGILVHSYMLSPSGDSNGCVSIRDYPAFLNAFLRGEVTRLVVVERLAHPPGTQFASGSFLKSLRDLFSGPERSTAAQPDRAIGYAAAGN
jgi:Protein of unknown function (DUF2778)